MSLSETLKSLAKNAILPDGKIKPFCEQVRQYGCGEIPEHQRLLVAAQSSELNLPLCRELPILVRQSVLRHIETDHNIKLSELEKLPLWLTTSPLSFDSVLWKDSLIVVVDFKDRSDNHTTIPIHLNRKKGEVSINEISSAYDWKNLQYFIDKSWELGAKLYLNERTSDWLTSARFKLPDYATNHLLNSNCSRNQNFIIVENNQAKLSYKNRVYDKKAECD